MKKYFALLFLLICTCVTAQINRAVIGQYGDDAPSLDTSLQVPLRFFDNDVEPTTISVKWNASFGAISYDIFLNDQFFVNTIKTSHIVTGLTENVNYGVKVRAVKSNGNFSNFTYEINVRTGLYPDEEILSVTPYTITSTAPALNVTYTNSFGLTERRVTDQATMGGDIPQVSGDYSKLHRFFYNDAHVQTTGSASPRLQFETTNWTQVTTQNHFRFLSTTEDASYKGNGNTLEKKDASGNVTSVKVFSDYDNVNIMPTAESNFSWDMRYVGLEGRKGTETWALAYDLITDTITTEILVNGGVGGVGNGWVAMSPNGAYMVVLISSGEPGASFRVYRNDGTNQEMPYGDVQSLNGGLATGHGDFQVTLQGNQCFVTRVSGKITMYVLDTGKIVKLFNHPIGQSNIGHISGKNIHQPGWAIVGDRTSASDPSILDQNGMDRLVYRKVFAVKLDENTNGYTETLTRVYGYMYQGSGVTGASTYAVPNKSATVVTYNKRTLTGQANEEMYAVYRE